MKRLSSRAKRELDGVHPALVAVVKRAWADLESDYELIDGIRTKAEQRNFVRRGVSRTMKSYHLKQADGFGHAVDIVPLVNGAPKWPDNIEPWREIERCMKRAARDLGVPIEWGGDWRNAWDKPHWQIPRVVHWKSDAVPQAEKPKGERIDHFREVLPLVLKHEGGYVNHPLDSGGPTNRGITLATLRRWRSQDVTAGDVKALTPPETELIYEAEYWDKLRCDDLPMGVDYCVFDFGVIAGAWRSAKFLQRAVGVEDDGRIGKATIRAVNAYVETNGRRALISQLAADRLAYHQGHERFNVFGRGWTARVEQMRDAALVMARRDKLPDIDRPVAAPKPPGEPKSLLGQILSALIKAFRKD